MKHIVVDTNTLVDDIDFILSFRDVTIVIPLVVFEELDMLKNRDGIIRSKSRYAINRLIEVMDLGNIRKGIYIRDTNSTIKVVWDDRQEDTHKDNRVLDVVDKVTYTHTETYFYTNDLSLRAKAEALGLKIYKPESKPSSICEDILQLYIPSRLIDKLYKDGYLENTIGDFKSNTYINLRDSYGTSQSALVRYDSELDEFVLVKNRRTFGINPKNSEQMCALDALLNPDIPVVILTGLAGSGKTILALASALEQVVEKQKYGHILISRPNVPIGNDLGFLPGNKEEKLYNWFGGYRDNIHQLLGSEDKFNFFVDTGVIELEALTYLRGRSLFDCFIIVDETQNLTKEQLKVIMTRVGNNSKIVLLGDITQIDNRFVDSETNGLAYLLRKMGDTDLIAHVELKNSEIRSKVTAWAVANL